MGAAPVTEIHGHDAKICMSFLLSRTPSADPRTIADGIDWSRRDSKKLVTCSLDKSFKVDLDALSTEASQLTPLLRSPGTSTTRRPLSSPYRRLHLSGALASCPSAREFSPFLNAATMGLASGEERRSSGVILPSQSLGSKALARASRSSCGGRGAARIWIAVGSCLF